MFIAAEAVVCLTVGFEPLVEGDWGHIFVLLFGLVFGIIGFLDDYEKLRHKANLGLTGKMKFLLQLAAAICFLFLLRRAGYLSPNLYIPFWNTTVPISEPVYFIFAAFVIVGTVNAVNLTDGVDGLAAGTCIPVFLCFSAIAFCWGKGFDGLGIFSAGLTGALMGFLIYNFNPARVFMGDTGSLFLGGCIAGMAFALDAPLILVPLCIMPIIETLSDIIQVTWFKLSHGKRVFLNGSFPPPSGDGRLVGAEMERKRNLRPVFHRDVGHGGDLPGGSGGTLFLLSFYRVPRRYPCNTAGPGWPIPRKKRRNGGICPICRFCC